MYIVFLQIQMFSLCLLVRQKKITCVKNLFLTVEVNSSKNANAVKQIVGISFKRLSVHGNFILNTKNFISTLESENTSSHSTAEM